MPRSGTVSQQGLPHSCAELATHSVVNGPKKRGWGWKHNRPACTA